MSGGEATAEVEWGDTDAGSNDDESRTPLSKAFGYEAIKENG